MRKKLILLNFDRHNLLKHYILQCIDEAVDNFFSSPRDDIELTMRLSRRDIYPRLHIDLKTTSDSMKNEARIIGTKSREHRLATIIQVFYRFFLFF